MPLPARGLARAQVGHVARHVRAGCFIHSRAPLTTHRGQAFDEGIKARVPALGVLIEPHVHRERHDEVDAAQSAAWLQEHTHSLTRERYVRVVERSQLPKGYQGESGGTSKSWARQQTQGPDAPVKGRAKNPCHVAVLKLSIARAHTSNFK